jgi:type IV secretory pathway VirB10-like protein
MTEFVTASAGAELLIWLVIIFIWGIAQLLKRIADQDETRRSAGRNVRSTSQQKPRRQQADAELQQFLQSLGVAQPPPQPAQPPAAPAARQQPASSARTPGQPATSERQPRQKTVRTRRRARLEPSSAQQDAAAKIREAMSIDTGNIPPPDRPVESYKPAAMRSKAGKLIGPSSMRLRTPSLSVGSGGAPRSRGTPQVSPRLRTRDDVRRAILHQLILEPPPSVRPPRKR